MDDTYDDPEFRAEDPGHDGEDSGPFSDSPYPDPSPPFDELPCEATAPLEQCPPPDDDQPDDDQPDDDQPDDDQPDANKTCNLGLAPLIYADPGQWAGTNGSIDGIAAGVYRFLGSESSPIAQSWSIALTGFTQATQFAPVGGNVYVSPPATVGVQIQAPMGAQPGDEHTLTVEVENILSQLVCTDAVTLRVPMDCSQPVSWWDGSSIYPSYDGANCFVTTPPAGTNPFVYANQYYVQSGPSTDCPLGSYDGANCYIQAAPPNAFIYDDKFYTLPLPGPSCPAGSGYDGAHCHWYSAPWGTTAFEYDGNWYTTPLPSCPVGNFDGANCWMGIPPAGTDAFLYAGNFYYHN